MFSKLTRLARPHFRATLLACGVMLVAAPGVGCKSAGGGRGESSSTPRSKGDPILGMRLPPQGVPVPGRGELAGERRDPILSSPAGRERDKPNGDKADTGGRGTGDVSALPPRTGAEASATAGDGRVPYRPSLAETPAALTNRHKLGDDTTTQRGTSNPTEPDRIARQLKSWGATWQPPTPTTSGYSVTVTVPQGAKSTGAVRRYDGSGDSAAAALQSAYEQVRDDKR